MRKVIGYIKNLVDGEGPSHGTVQVNAWPWQTRTETPDSLRELENTRHKLGHLAVLHLNTGSGSPTLADDDGRFGWEMELSPGPIDTHVTPSDPQTEYRLRLPDESAQVGKAFHSDIERLGWAAGRDCLVWGAIEGGNLPAAGQWTGDPLVTGKYGDWSIDLDATTAAPGKIVLRPGIAFLGGVLFSVERGNLTIPVAGEVTALANPNTGAADRWDLLAIKMSIDRSTAEAEKTYGRQSFVIQEGAPGGGVPTLAVAPGSRMLVLHALKMPAGGSAYTQVYDLRRWREPPTGTTVSQVATSRSWWVGGVETIFSGPGFHQSQVNAVIANNELTVPLGSAYAGLVNFTTNLLLTSAQPDTAPGAYFQMTSEGRLLPGSGTVYGGNYLVNHVSGSFPVAAYVTGGPVFQQVSLTFPITRIPSGAEGRTWHRLRFLLYQMDLGGDFSSQYPTVTANLWPVP